MDLSDIPAAPELADPQALLAQLGGEVARSLSRALERLAALQASGHIDARSLRALQFEVEQARRAGIVAQQIVRLRAGAFARASERIDLAALLHEALRQQGREIARRRLQLRLNLMPAAVASDATLLYALLQAALDWAFALAASPLDLVLDAAAATGGVPLSIRLAADAAGPEALDTMAWRLLEQLASALAIPLERRCSGGRLTLRLTLPGAGPAAAGSAVESTDSLLSLSQPLAGRHLLVVAARRDTRQRLREALRPLGSMIDFVPSVEVAQAFCAGALPHALVYEAGLGGERFDRLRDAILAREPGLALVCVAEEGSWVEVRNEGPRQLTSVGRDAVAQALPAALLFELDRQA
ncbi:MAG: hypothetical protein KGL50_03875 [Burkholderiales bacterium]|nr:hypothetical protein [Burkholderiales bacterium]